MKKVIASIIIIILLAASQPSFSQCAMCRRIAETNMESKQNNVGRNLNKGILYLMSLPYLIGSIGVFAWYKQKRKNRNLVADLNNKQQS
jgi:hypothetical protein